MCLLTGIIQPIPRVNIGICKLNNIRYADENADDIVLRTKTERKLQNFLGKREEMNKHTIQKHRLHVCRQKDEPKLQITGRE